MKLKLTTIKQKITISTSPEEVYEAFVNPERHTAFTGSKATGKAEVGEEFTAWDEYIQGKNLELKKGKRLVQEWKTTEWPADYPPSIFKLTFKKTKSGTEVTMEHSNVPVELAEDLKQGWIDFYWKPLKKYFKRHP